MKSGSNLVPGYYCQSQGRHGSPSPFLAHFYLMISMLYLNSLNSLLFLKIVQEQKVRPSVVGSLDRTPVPGLGGIRTLLVLGLLDIYMDAAAASVVSFAEEMARAKEGNSPSDGVYGPRTK